MTARSVKVSVLVHHDKQSSYEEVISSFVYVRIKSYVVYDSLIYALYIMYLYSTVYDQRHGTYQRIKAATVANIQFDSLLFVLDPMSIPHISRDTSRCTDIKQALRKQTW